MAHLTHTPRMIKRGPNTTDTEERKSFTGAGFLFFFQKVNIFLSKSTLTHLADIPECHLVGPGCTWTGVEGVESVSWVRCWCWRGGQGTSNSPYLAPWPLPHVHQYQRQIAWVGGLNCLLWQLLTTTRTTKTWGRSRLRMSRYFRMVINEKRVQRRHGSTSDYLFSFF